MRDIKELGHHGDRLTHELVDLINRTFVTPFDRDDMYRLAGVLDDICDHVDDTAENSVLYGVREVRPQRRRQAEVTQRASAHAACRPSLCAARGRLCPCRRRALARARRASAPLGRPGAAWRDRSCRAR